MSRRYRLIETAPCHFITSSTVWWTPIFISKGTCDVLIESFAYCRREKGLQVFAYVIMPTHFHAIVGTRESVALTHVMRDLKRHTARKLDAVLEDLSWELPLRVFRKAASLEERGNQYKVWQDEFHPIALETEEVFLQKLEYLHANPVRKGLVKKPEDWWYSSCRTWLDGTPGPLELDEVGG
jgi:REP element-mobilizing transposase RayT